MNPHRMDTARKTQAFFACLLCGYTGPLAYDSRVAMCQQCQCAAPGYLVPHCPSCGLYTGMATARSAAERGEYNCPSCGYHWQER